MVTKVSHVTLYVDDQEKAYEVYVHKLGFRVTNDTTLEGGLRWLTVSPPGQPELEILLAEPKEPMIIAEMVPHFRALLARNAIGGAVLECDDCRATYEDLKAKGIAFTKPPTEEFYGIEALFTDGCGNWFSLTEHPEAVDRQ